MGQGRSNFRYFPNLPAEIQREILQMDPEVLKRSQLVSKGIAKITSQPYLKQICTAPLSQDDIMQLFYNVETFGYIYISLNLSMILIENRPSRRFDRNHAKAFYSELTMGYISNIDILTEFESLSQRSSCIRIDPKYPWHQIIVKINSMSKADIKDKFMYAMLSAGILNLIDLADEDIFHSDETQGVRAYTLAKYDINYMEKRANELYPMIRNEFKVET